ncbi:hypothetical protein PPJ95_06165, partial [Limosilactobacillus reuteri]|nr:hypothetical protein [Limosilactobacillus reuteri]
MKDILVAYLTWKNSISSPNTLKKYTGSVEIYCGMVFGVKGGFKLSFYSGLKMYDLVGLRIDR